MKRKYPLNQDVFSKIDTEEKAYWLGFILADGNIYINNKNYQQLLQVGLSLRDKEHLEKLSDFLGTNIPIKINNKVGSCILQIHSKKIVSDLLKLGIEERKSGKEKFILLDNEELQRHLVRGYVDGDGSISFNARNKLYPNNLSPSMTISGSYEFLQDVDLFLHKSIQSPLTSIHKNNSIFAIGKNSSSAKKVVKFLYSNCSIFLTRKYKTALLCINWNPKINKEVSH
jgi:intein-encoded DNA endonuclease-like protein